ncbi:Holliday junction branch migration DNA helicase RuvB [candidate division KSB1 bacterium]|nr:MAG: Holliday junction branch migration DNA helicase RuvB [candidate division KSB1 bacterium]
MSVERLVTRKSISKEEDKYNISLRPSTLKEYIGQKELKEKLSISIEAARRRNEPVEHTLLYGPPGLGKTTLAHIIASEMNSKIIVTSGPALIRTGDLMGILTNLNRGDVLFIDEIHRLSTVVEEFLYPAMEDFKVDFVVDKGAFAKTINIPLQKFTLVGATTRAGFLSAPLRNRFGIHHHIGFYAVDELVKIIKRSASILDTKIDDDATYEIAKRSRGTPRIANRLLRRVRDYVQVKSDGKITKKLAILALEMEGIDEKGLDELDRKYLRILIEHYNGGPAGIESLAASLNEESDTLQDIIEPFLLKIGFLKRTRQGRKIGDKALAHLGIKKSNSLQSSLF